MAYGFIYITTNKINGKKYLGMCAYHKKNHQQYLGSGKILKRAIKKYGKENFEREKIFEAETKEELTRKEIELIEFYKCIDDIQWYNLVAGGYSTRGFLGKKHSEETKALMRKNHKRPVYEKTRAAFRENAAKLRPLANETNKKYIETHGHGYNVKAIIVNGVHYVSIKEYAKAEGIKPSSATARLKRRKENVPSRAFSIEGTFYKSAKDYANKHNLDYEKNRKKIRALIKNNLSEMHDLQTIDFSYS